MRGVRALLAAVIVMGVMIVVGSAILVSVVVRRAMHQASPALAPATASIGVPEGAVLALDQPPGTHILSVTRQSDSLLAIALGGGGAERLLIWDPAHGRVVARLTLGR